MPPQLFQKLMLFEILQDKHIYQFTKSQKPIEANIFNNLFTQFLQISSTYYFIDTMGGLLPSSATQFNPQRLGWSKQKSPEGTTVWTHPITKQQLEQYYFVVNDAASLSQEEKSFKMRLNSEYLVAGKYFTNSSQNELCSTIQSGNLFIEKIPLRLSQVKQIPYPDVLHVYHQSFIGFDILQKNVGPFDINEDMICFTVEGKAKVWLNSDLSKGMPDLRFDGTSATQAGMLRRLLDLIQTNSYSSGNPHNIKQILRQNNVVTFAEASLRLQQLCDLSKINIPAAMKSVIQVNNVMNSSNSTTQIKGPKFVEKVQNVLPTPHTAPKIISQSHVIHSKNANLQIINSPEINQVKSHLNILSSPKNIVNSLTNIPFSAENIRPLSSTIYRQPTHNLPHSPHTIPDKYLSKSKNVNFKPIGQKNNTQTFINTKSTNNFLNIQNPTEIVDGKQHQTRNGANAKRSLNYESVLKKQASSDNKIVYKNFLQNNQSAKVDKIQNPKPLTFKSKNSPVQPKTSSYNPVVPLSQQKQKHSNNKTTSHSNILNNRTATTFPKTVSSYNDLNKNKYVHVKDAPNLQFAQKPLKPEGNLKADILKKYYSAKGDSGRNVDILNSKSQIIEVKQKVSEVYKQLSQKSVLLQQKNLTNFETINKNSSIANVFNSQAINLPPSLVTKNQVIYRNSPIKKQVSSQNILKLNQNNNLSEQNHLATSNVPLAFSSKYFIPSSSCAIDPYKHSGNTSNLDSQKLVFVQNNLNFSNQNGSHLQCSTSQPDYAGVTYSFGANRLVIKQHQQGGTFQGVMPNIIKKQIHMDGQLMGDIQRMRMNALETKPCPI